MKNKQTTGYKNNKTVQSFLPKIEESKQVNISNQTFEDFVFNMPDYKLEILKEVNGGYERIDSAYAGWKITNADITNIICNDILFIAI